MLTLERLQQARDHGLLKSSQVQPLYDFLLADPEEIASSPDAEELHFLRGFHDIFVSLGMIILAAGFAIGVSFLFNGSVLEDLITYGGLMGLAWILAEWLTKRLRLALPSLLLALGFALSAFLASDALLGLILGDTGNVLLGKGLFYWERATIDGSNLHGTGLIAFLIALVATFGFYKRFKVPITPALMMISGVGLVLYLIGTINLSILTNHMIFWLLLVGFACLTIAMMFDIRDPKRQTLNSDKAFWLHLVAAPILVHACLSSFADKEGSGFTSLITILLVVGLGLLALIIDRRAMLASALGYLGFAIGQLLDQIDLDSKGIAALTLLIVGLFVLMLGSGWPRLRGLVMRPFANSSWAKYLPPVSV